MKREHAIILICVAALISMGVAVLFYQHQLRVDREFQNYKVNGIVEFNNRQFGNAVQEFVTALHFKPKDVEVRTLIVSAYKKSKSYDLAEKFILESLKLLPENPVLLTELGYVYLDWGKLDKAEDVFEKLVDTKIDPLEGYDGLAEVEIKRQNYGGALQYFESSKPFLERLDKRKDKEKLAKSFYRIALFMKEIGRLGVAVELLTGNLKLTPLDLNVYFELAQLYEYVKDKEKAIHYYGSFLEAAGPLHQEKIQFSEKRIEALKRDEFLPPPPVIPLK